MFEPASQFDLTDFVQNLYGSDAGWVGNKSNFVYPSCHTGLTPGLEK